MDLFFAKTIEPRHKPLFSIKYYFLDTVSFSGLFCITKLKCIRLRRGEALRLVNPDRRGNRPIREAEISPNGTVVHLKGYGFILVFKIVAPDGDIDYWATNDLHLNHLQRLQWAEYEWSIEEYHRGLKQCCGVDKYFARSARAQRNHIGFSIRAFLRLEIHRFLYY